MRIAHILYAFSNLSETFIFDLIKTQSEEGDECHILTFKRENTETRPFSNDYVHKIKRSKWNFWRYWNYLKASLTNQNKTTVNWHLYRKQVTKKLRKIKPDIMHAHFGDMGVLALPVSEKLNIPLVVSFHGRDAFELPKQKYWKKEFENLFQQADAITVVSEYMREHIMQLTCPADKVFVVHVGKNVDDYPFKVRQGNLKKWISVGRLAEKKGFSDCLDAFGQLSEYYPDIELIIIGDGPLKKALEKQIGELELSESITLLGAVSHEQVIQQLSKADVFILCSKTSKDGDKEGIPTVLMEAQAMGLPCVTTQHSGIPEVIPAENKIFMAPEGDVNAIARCMKKLYTAGKSDRKKIARSGRKKIEQEFNIDYENRKLKNIYNQILSK